MDKKYTLCAFLLVVLFSKAQEVALPVDLRQHNLTEFNSSLFNPVFTLDRNMPQSIAFWSRYQWQSIDSDPTTIFLNYSRKIGRKSGMSVGFMQNNTGEFLNTGGLLNFAHAFNFGKKIQLAVGFNVFAYSREISDNAYISNPDILIPQLEVSKDFIMQFAPGARLSIGKFSLGFASENVFDYNFSTNKSFSEADEKMYMGMMDYKFPLKFGNGLKEAYIRPMVYAKTVPYTDDQYGGNLMISSNKFWMQGGYNSFYGVSAGVGGRFFKHVSLGALIEHGLDNGVKDQGPSFEIIVGYTIGKKKQGDEDKELGTEEDSNELMILDEKKKQEDELKKAKEQYVKEGLSKAEALAEKNAKKEARKKKTVRGKKRKALEEEMRVAEELAVAKKMKEKQEEAKRLEEKQEAEDLARALQLKEQQRLDSIENAALAYKKKIQEDADRIAEKKKAGQAITKGKYQEGTKIEGQKAGFYLICNVYSTVKYRDLFINGLSKKGINAKYFYFDKTKWDYVYLERFDTLSEAEVARDNDFNGRYKDETWIFRMIED